MKMPFLIVACIISGAIKKREYHFCTAAGMSAEKVYNSEWKFQRLTFFNNGHNKKIYVVSWNLISSDTSSSQLYVESYKQVKNLDFDTVVLKFQLNTYIITLSLYAGTWENVPFLKKKIWMIVLSLKHSFTEKLLRFQQMLRVWLLCDQGQVTFCHCLMWNAITNVRLSQMNRPLSLHRTTLGLNIQNSWNEITQWWPKYDLSQMLLLSLSLFLSPDKCDFFFSLTFSTYIFMYCVTKQLFKTTANKLGKYKPIYSKPIEGRKKSTIRLRKGFGNN